MSWGLVLSGGAAWGIANAGVLEVLEREELRPDVLAGSSMGAIIGAVWAMGHPAAAIVELCEQIRLIDVAKIATEPLKGGLHGGLLQQNLHRYLEPLLGQATIGDCKMPFVCVAAKVKTPIDWTGIIHTGFSDVVERSVELHVFAPDTLLIDAVMASSAIPVAFAPYEIDGAQYVDLVHFGAIPARTLQRLHAPRRIIATDTNPPHEQVGKLLPAGWREFLDRGQASLQQSKDVCDLVIRPDMPAAPWRFDRAAAFIDAGRTAAELALPDIQRVLGL